jgi:hypothetical protein
VDIGNTDIGPDFDDADAEDILKIVATWSLTGSQLQTVKNIIADGPVWEFRDLNHLYTYITNPSPTDPPKMETDFEGAEYLDAQARKFGSTFKGPTIPFSGQRVYAVAYSQGEESFWAMQNSATGHISSKDQSVVRTWSPQPIPYTFPSNTAAAFSKAGLKKPEALKNNAHAEVNEVVAHTIRSIRLGLTAHDVNLIFASDIKHCAECYWAAHAFWKKANKQMINKTGCANKLFERWRQPWDGFYKDYGDNPFRNPDGTFKSGFSAGTWDPAILNAQVSGSVGNIYI